MCGKSKIVNVLSNVAHSMKIEKKYIIMPMGYKLPCALSQDHKESKGPIHYSTSGIIWDRVSKMAKCLLNIRMFHK